MDSRVEYVKYVFQVVTISLVGKSKKTLRSRSSDFVLIRTRLTLPISRIDHGTGYIVYDSVRNDERDSGTEETTSQLEVPDFVSEFQYHSWLCIK